MRHPLRGRTGPALLLTALPLLAGCAGPEADAEKLPTVVLAVPEAPAGKPDPGEVRAREAMLAEDYSDGLEVYEQLSQRVADPARRAEYLFLAAECALGAKDHFIAHRAYRRLLRLYPNSPRYPRAIERLFLIGRLYAQGKAQKPSWLLGIDMRDREFGIKTLEAFQKGRERHPLADDALHYIALAQLHLGEWELAIQAWTSLGRLYPKSEWADTAEYRVALTMVESMSDGPVYDKAPITTGIKRLKAYIKTHSTGDHIVEANAALRRVEEALGEQLLAQVRFYLRRSRTYSALVYLAAIQREFPRTDAAKEAKTLQAKIPKTSPPGPPPEPKDAATETDEERASRLRLAPVPIDDSW